MKQRKGMDDVRRHTAAVVCLVMALMVLLGSAQVALAFPPQGKVGQDSSVPHPDYPVTRVEFREYDDGWYLIMPYRGNFGGTPYLDDGWIINVWTHRQGQVWLYVFVHDSDPRAGHSSEGLWGTWNWFLGVGAGKETGASSGPFYKPGR